MLKPPEVHNPSRQCRSQAILVKPSLCSGCDARVVLCRLFTIAAFSVYFWSPESGTDRRNYGYHFTGYYWWGRRADRGGPLSSSHYRPVGLRQRCELHQRDLEVRHADKRSFVMVQTINWGLWLSNKACDEWRTAGKLTHSAMGWMQLSPPKFWWKDAHSWGIVVATPSFKTDRFRDQIMTVNMKRIGVE